MPTGISTAISSVPVPPVVIPSGIRWFTRVLASGGVGTIGRVRIFHNTPRDQLIDRFIFCVTAGGTPPAIEFFVGSRDPGAAGGTQVRTTEEVTLVTGGNPSRPLPILTLVDAIAPIALTQNFYSVVGDTSGEGTIQLPAEIVIPAAIDPFDITNAPCITVQTSHTDQPYRLSVTGLFFE